MATTELGKKTLPEMLKTTGLARKKKFVCCRAI